MMFVWINYWIRYLKLSDAIVTVTILHVAALMTQFRFAQEALQAFARLRSANKEIK